MSAAIEKGGVHLEEIEDRNDPDDFEKIRHEYRFDPEEKSLLSLRGMNIPIP